MRRDDNQRRQLPRLRQKSDGLYRFAQAHLVRQQRALVAQQVGQPFLLEGHQFACKKSGGRRDGFRIFFRDGAAQRPFPRALDRVLPAGQVARGDFERIAHHQPVETAGRAPVERETRLAPRRAFAFREEPRDHLDHARIGLDRPAFGAAVVAERTVGAFAGDGFTQIGGQKRLAGRFGGVKRRLRRERIVDFFGFGRVVAAAGKPAGRLVVRPVGQERLAFFVHSATPQSLCRPIARSGLPQTVSGSAGSRSETTTTAETSGLSA